LFISPGEIRVIPKVMKRQHQNPEFDHKRGKTHLEFGYRRGEIHPQFGHKRSDIHPQFGHKRGEFKSNLQTSTLAFKGGMKVSACRSFLLRASKAPTYTANIILLELCALNAESQNFKLRFNKIPLLDEYQ
jgi:hypothetical protein